MRACFSRLWGARETVLYVLLAGTLILNLVDMVSTMMFVLSGAALEANPLLAGLLADSPLSFGAVKIGLVSLGSSLLWRYRQHPAALFGASIAFGSYALVLLVHMQGLSFFV